MNDNNSKALRPVYLQEGGFSTDDEVNLVDLATIVVRRKIIVITIMMMITALGTVIAFTKPKAYTFSNTIEIGSYITEGTTNPFETPEALLTKLEFSFIPQILNDYKISSSEDKNRYNILASTPRNSGLIVLQIKGTEDKSSILINLLKSTTDISILEHKRVHDAIKRRLTALVKQSENSMSLLNNNNGSQALELQLHKNELDKYNSQLVSLRNTREISPPIKSVSPTGSSKKLILIITIISAIFFGGISAFFAEFISKVRKNS